MVFNSRYPRLNRESLLPIAKHVDSALLLKGSAKQGDFDQPPVDLSGWYPPGHGDVYRSFCQSGLAEQLRAAGKEWIFISNIDNLGACVDLSELFESLCVYVSCASNLSLGRDLTAVLWINFRSLTVL